MVMALKGKKRACCRTNLLPHNILQHHHGNLLMPMLHRSGSLLILLLRILLQMHGSLLMRIRQSPILLQIHGSLLMRTRRRSGSLPILLQVHGGLLMPILRSTTLGSQDLLDLQVCLVAKASLDILDSLESLVRSDNQGSEEWLARPDILDSLGRLVKWDVLGHLGMKEGPAQQGSLESLAHVDHLDILAQSVLLLRQRQSHMVIHPRVRTYELEFESCLAVVSAAATSRLGWAFCSYPQVSL